MNWRREFSCESFSLKHENASEFSASKWQKDQYRVSPWYLTYRLVVFATCFAILVANGTVTDKGYYWFIFLTNLGFSSLVLYSLVALVVVLEKLFYERDGYFRGEMTLLVKVSWVLSNIVTLVSVVITLVYWIALHKPEDGVSPMNFFVHGLNMILTITDIFVSAKPCRILHFYQPILALLSYFVFTAIYWMAGGTNHKGENFIYPIVKWENPTITMGLAVAVLFAVPILQSLLYGLHFLRDSIHNSLFSAMVDQNQNSTCNQDSKIQVPENYYDNKAFSN